MRRERGAATWLATFSPAMVPIPRVSVFVSPDPEDGDTLTLGLDLSSAHGEPVAVLEVTFPWRRPRPWQADLTWPPRPLSGRTFEWEESAPPFFSESALETIRALARDPQEAIRAHLRGYEAVSKAWRDYTAEEGSSA